MTSVISAVFVVSMSLAQTPAPRVGVADISATKDLAPLAGAVAGSVANELQRLGSFPVTTTEQIRNLLSLERQNQLLGCSDDQCKGSVVSQLGFDYLVSGRLTKLAGKKEITLTLELSLIHVQSGKREASDVVTATSESELFGKVPGSAIKLVQSILKGRSGALVVLVSEVGATVKVDDVVLGVSPLNRQTLAGGPHLLQIEKDGFVTVKREFRIQPDQTTEESTRMVPSPDYIAQYEAKNSRLRLGGYIAIGGVVAGVAAGIVFQVLATNRYGSQVTDGTFAFYQSKLVQGLETNADGSINYRSKAGQAKADVQLYGALTWVGFGVAALSAVTAVTLFVLGDDPGKYAPYKQPVVKASAMLLPQGAGGVVTVAF